MIYRQDYFIKFKLLQVFAYPYLIKYPTVLYKIKEKSRALINGKEFSIYFQRLLICLILFKFIMIKILMILFIIFYSHDSSDHGRDPDCHDLCPVFDPGLSLVIHHVDQ